MNTKSVAAPSHGASWEIKHQNAHQMIGQRKVVTYMPPFIKFQASIRSRMRCCSYKDVGCIAP
jgi:hypothetical protein